MTPKVKVIYEDNHLLVVSKSQGIATMGAKAGETSMVDLAASYLKNKYSKPGNVYVGVVSRLDKRVSGLLVLARTSKCAARLSKQIRDRTIRKRYLAITQGPYSGAQNAWVNCEDWVRKNEKLQRMMIADQSTPEAQKAVLRYKYLGGSRHESLLEVDLITGRKNQIRLQLANLGFPILGDTKYASSTPAFKGGIALHCAALEFAHPTKSERLQFTDPPLHWPTRFHQWLSV